MRLDDHARLVGGDHVLDVNVGVLPPEHLKHLQSLVDQLPHVVALPLSIRENL